MRPIEPPSPLNPRRTGRPAADSRKAFIACCLVAGLGVVAAVIAGRSTEGSSRSQRTAADFGLSTGSVLIVPREGQICQQRTIDNSTWRMHDNGSVDCAEAMDKSRGSEPSGRWSGSRVDIIRDAFRHNP
jgi:hypothetical protein